MAELCPKCTHDLTIATNGDRYCQICGYEKLARSMQDVEGF